MSGKKIVRTIHDSCAAPIPEHSASFGTIKSRLESLQPEKATDAGKAYSAIAKKLAENARLLTEKHAQALTDAWGGDAAQKALDQLKQIHWTANELATKSTQSAQTMNWYGTEILPWYRDAGKHMSDGLIHTSGDDHRAQDLMTRLNGRTAEAQNGMPDTITQDLPDHLGDGGVPTSPGGPGSPSGPGGVPSGGGGGGANLPKNDPFGKRPPNYNPHLSNHDGNFPGNDPGNLPGGTGDTVGTGGSSSLAGYNPPGLGGGPGGLGGDPLGGAGAGFVGGGPGGFGASPGSMGAGGVGFGAGPGLGAGAGLGKSGVAAEADGMGMSGRGMMPMAGGHGQGEKERERSTWLSEDEDIWGGDGDAAPPLIG